MRKYAKCVRCDRTIDITNSNRDLCNYCDAKDKGSRERTKAEILEYLKTSMREKDIVVHKFEQIDNTEKAKECEQTIIVKEKEAK